MIFNQPIINGNINIFANQFQLVNPSASILPGNPQGSPQEQNVQGNPQGGGAQRGVKRPRSDDASPIDSQDSIPAKKVQIIQGMQSPHASVQKVAKEKLIDLSRPYDGIENVDISYKNRKINLYPTKKVNKVIKKFKDSGMSQKHFPHYVNKQVNKGFLSIEEDTTLYFPKEFKKKFKKVTVDSQSNALYRNHRELDKKLHIFVLSKESELFTTKKQIKSEHGRIHHSSLASGESVRTAGMIQVNKQFDKTHQILITNVSGHYKPSPGSLDRIVHHLAEQGLRFQVISDITKQKKHGEIRSLILQTEK